MPKFKIGDLIYDKGEYGKKNNRTCLVVDLVDPRAGLIPYKCSTLSGDWYGWVTEDDAVDYNVPVEQAETGHPRFVALCDEMKAVHRKKGADYGSDKDIFENIRRSERIGIPASKGCWLRASDKVGRLDKFFSGQALINESALDSLIDLANYCLIAVCLLEDEQAKKGESVGTN